MRVTIKDIAKKAGVSYMTVSRALNDSALVNEKTKKKIKKIAKDMNYSPNINARALRMEKSFNIGIFFSSINIGTSPEFFHEVMIEVNKKIDPKYNLIVKGIDQIKSLNNINSINFDGIIVISQREEEDDLIIEKIIKERIPVVVLNRSYEGVSSVYTNDYLGAYMAAKNILQKGHRDIAIIKGGENQISRKLRDNGIERALEEQGVKIPDKWQGFGDYKYRGGYRVMKEILEGEDLPSAVLCQNDDMAIAAIKAILESGLQVPEDISVVGYDNGISSEFIYPELTTVDRKIREVVNKGVEILLNKIDGNQENYSVKIEPKWIERNSLKNK